MTLQPRAPPARAQIWAGIGEAAPSLHTRCRHRARARAPPRRGGAPEWPEGAKPVTKKAQYDDLYRVKRVDYQYSDGDDVWKSPFEAENSGNPALQDTRRAKPSPHVAFDKRVLSQSYAYDWLGNTSASDDDAHGFYDRSLGTIGNGPTGGTNPKPYQLTSADNLAKPGTRTGRLAARYDDAGNLTRLAVDRGGPCLPTGSACNQLFAYEWDEVGRLNRARRWDISSSAVTSIDGTLPTAPAAADLSHAYDAGDQRVIKTARDAAGAERHTVYIFDCLELRRAEWKLGGGIIDDFDYAVTATTEVGYLFANGVRLARLVYEPTEHDVPTFTGAARLHVFFELGDHLGSTSVVLDKATGELVERGTYEAYGSKESDYRPERWSGFREDYGFTGKEEDVTVGLHYFGKRFLSTHLNRWVSADPLAVHAPGEADLNVYAYVSGRALQAVDPLGLDYEAPDHASNPANTIERERGTGADAQATQKLALASDPPNVSYEQNARGEWFANVELKYKVARRIDYVVPSDTVDPKDGGRSVREHEFAHHAAGSETLSKESVDLMLGSVGARLKFRVAGPEASLSDSQRESVASRAIQYRNAAMETIESYGQWLEERVVHEQQRRTGAHGASPAELNKLRTAISYRDPATNAVRRPNQRALESLVKRTELANAGASEWVKAKDWKQADPQNRFVVNASTTGAPKLQRFQGVEMAAPLRLRAQ